MFINVTKEIPMSAEVYILGPQFSTFVRCVMIACEEKGVSYGYGMELDAQPLALGGEVHRKLHPYGKIPVLLIDGQAICETATILRFIDARFASGNALIPKEPFNKAEVDQWSHLISNYIDQAIVRRVLLEFARPKGENGTVRMDKVEKAMPGVFEALEILSRQLGLHDYLCGEQFSMADILLIPQLDYLAKSPAGSDVLAGFKQLRAYIERVRARPSCQAVLK